MPLVDAGSWWKATHSLQKNTLPKVRLLLTPLARRCDHPGSWWCRRGAGGILACRRAGLRSSRGGCLRQIYAWQPLGLLFERKQSWPHMASHVRRGNQRFLRPICTFVCPVSSMEQEVTDLLLAVDALNDRACNPALFARVSRLG